MLSPLDHFIKEKLRIKFYLRYMDDFIMIHEDQSYLEYCRAEIQKFLAKGGFELHPRKTRIQHVTDKLTFLGFDYLLTSTGKVVMLVSSEAVKRNRKKLFRMVQKVKRGEMPRSKVDECFKCQLDHLRKGNSFKLLQRYCAYYKSLWR